MKYSLDSSSILNPWRHWHRPQSFPTLWGRYAELIDSGAIVAIEEVRHEIEKKDDEVLAWVKERRGLFVPIDDEIQAAVTDILGKHPRLLKHYGGERSGADAWVIALARVKNLVVLTEEQLSGSAERPRIPDVCRDLGIHWISFLDLIQEYGWTF